MYFVYIVQCNDGFYYTGVTNDLERRVNEHNSGLIEGFTSKRLPVRLMHQQGFQFIDDAIRAEKQIKGWSRKKKEALINADFALLRLLAKRKGSAGDPSTGSG
ncbi:MAG: GIY-YIG nuclease family protein [Chitinispirillaceae bacterium]|nr:GIY-YIG nuclease family protein [Chitinispirillaceae bacterium]